MRGEDRAEADALQQWHIRIGSKFEHTFADAEDPCEVVTPPTETPVATPTVVSAGIVDDAVISAADDLRTEQGIALIASGLVLLLAAGGLARPKRAQR